MPENVELSISIVNTNNCALLRDCLRSIWDTTKEASFEVIVVDNASTDGSADMVTREFPEVRLITSDKRGGYGESHNKGILASRGEFVLIFNEDMVVLDGALDAMVRKLKQDPTIGAIGARLLYTDGSLQHSCFREPSLRRALFDQLVPWRFFLRNSNLRGKMYEWDHNDEREVDIVMGCCILAPRRVLDKAGLFDPQFFVYSEEDDLCKRIRNCGYKVLFLPEAQMIHVGGQTSKTMSVKMSLVQTQSKVRYFEKHRGKIAAFTFRIVLAGGSTIRLIGWAALWTSLKRKRPEAQAMITKYWRTLALLAGLTKP